MRGNRNARYSGTGLQGICGLAGYDSQAAAQAAQSQAQAALSAAQAEAAQALSRYNEHMAAQPPKTLGMTQPKAGPPVPIQNPAWQPWENNRVGLYAYLRGKIGNANVRKGQLDQINAEIANLAKAKQEAVAGIDTYLSQFNEAWGKAPDVVKQSPQAAGAIAEEVKKLNTTKGLLQAADPTQVPKIPMPSVPPPQRIVDILRPISEKLAKEAVSTDDQFRDGAGNPITEAEYIKLSKENGEEVFLGPDGREWPKSEFERLEREPDGYILEDGTVLTREQFAEWDKLEKGEVAWLEQKTAAEVQPKLESALTKEGPPPPDTRKPGLYFMGPLDAPDVAGAQPPTGINGLGDASMNAGQVLQVAQNVQTAQTGDKDKINAAIMAQLVEPEIQKILLQETNKAAVDVGKAMQRTAILQAAISTTIAIAGAVTGAALTVGTSVAVLTGAMLGFAMIPIIGWIIAAVLAVVVVVLTVVSGVYKREAQRIISEANKQVERMQQLFDLAIRNYVNVTFDAIYKDAYAEAVKEAGFDAPLNLPPLDGPPAAPAKGLSGHGGVGFWPAIAAFMAQGGAAMNAWMAQASAAMAAGAANVAATWQATQATVGQAANSAMNQMYDSMYKGLMNLEGRKPKDRSVKGRVKDKVRRLDPTRYVKKVGRWFEKEVRRFGKNMQNVHDDIVGKTMVEKARKMKDMILMKGVAEIGSSFHKQKSAVDHPVFRKALKDEIKKAIANSAPWKSLLKQRADVIQARLDLIARKKKLDQVAVLKPDMDRQRQENIDRLRKELQALIAGNASKKAIQDKAAELEKEQTGSVQSSNLLPILGLAAAGAAVLVLANQE
jgi:hypothetical protein